MPRKKAVSDDEVLDAANAVLAERGGTAFTLNDVARKVGLARATLIQRFANRDTILQRMAEREVVATEQYLASFPVRVGLSGLRQFLRGIVQSMGSGEDFSVRVLVAFVEATDPQLRAYAARRYALVEQAIFQRLPETPDRAVLARHLHTVIAGASMRWVAERDGRLGDFVCRCVAEALAYRFPDDDDVANLAAGRL